LLFALGQSCDRDAAAAEDGEACRGALVSDRNVTEHAADF